jgi:hypothetical protein
MWTAPGAHYSRPRQYAECIIAPKSVLPLTSPLGGSVTMGNCGDLGARRWAARWLGAAFLGLAAIISLPLGARAQDTAIITRGDAAVTAFSGARQVGEVPADLHPLDLTFIDTNGATLQVFDLTELGGPSDGQVANAPVKFQATAGEIGQVFGVTLDGDTANATPNIYVTSTSLFGLQIVSAEGDRLVKGEPGARWMPGQFGLDKGGSPGSVWKIDGATGFVSLFANIKYDGKDNAGPGLGDIAYDPTTHQFFVSDLETGLIHRLGLDGSDRGTFDHGTAGRAKAGLDPVAYDAAGRMNIESPAFDIETPSTWGFADKRRKVFAVAVQGERLYYSVDEGPQIWSVGLNVDGSFADDAELEIDVTGTPNGNVITGIAFDGAGSLYLAQRGELVGSYDYSVFAKPEASAVLHYVWDETEQRWSTEADEYAIGLKPPHRSTEGGIALNYGYDPDGNIDYNQCRATLWTTGEHLREGEDADRVAQGGASIIHGLQGNDKSLVRPANVPPFESWFVDNDGLFLDANVYGHVGDIAIFNPCDKRTIAESEPLPYPPPFPYYPPLPEPEEPEEHVGPGIFIDKLCGPAIFGGEIHCTITVTNIGETLSDPVDIWDAATILSGPGAGGGIIISGVAPDGPDWICSPTPTPDLWCSLPPDAIEPGETRSIDVWIDTGPLFAAGDFGFRNCAVLEEPWGGVACDDGGTDITVVKTAPAACDPGADCTFTVTITNTGTLGFSGEVLLTDAMFLPGGADLGAPITSIVPDPGCVPVPAAVPFSCVATLTLAPGASLTFAITVTMPAMPPAYWAQNCFAISAPVLPPPPLPLAPGVESDSTSCAWVPVGAPAPLNNFRVDKRALHGGQCYKLPGVIPDLPDLGGIPDVPLPDPGVPIPPLPEPGVPIPPLPEDGVPGVPLPEDGVPGVPLPEPGIPGVPLPEPAAPDETIICDYEIEIINDGPAPFAGEVAFTDTVPAGATAAMPPAPWACAAGPPLTCSMLGAAMAAGDSITVPVTVTIPLATLEAAGCEMPNTAALTAPAAGTDSNFFGGDDSDTAVANAFMELLLPDGTTLVTCDPTNLKTTKVAKGDCVASDGGYRCDYTVIVTNMGPDPYKGPIEINEQFGFAPSSVTFSPEWGHEGGGASYQLTHPPVELEKGESIEISVTATVPEGKQCELRNTAIMTRPEAPSRFNNVAGDDAATAWAKIPAKGCVKPDRPQCEPKTNELRSESGDCVCKSGFVRNEKGQCVGLTEPPVTEPKLCPDGKPVPKSGRCPVMPPQCVPGPNEERNAQDQCVCKPGFERDSKGRCVEPETPPEACGPNEVRNAQGQCVCKSGYQRDKNGRCVAPPTPPEACGPNEMRNAQGQCVCKSGYERDKNGRCVSPPDPGPECRKKGWIWDGKRCLSPADACKLRGWNWDDGRCLSPATPANECKKKGWTWDGKRCLSPADACKAKGWNWTGTRCVEPTSPADECRKKGGVWDGKRCLSPAEICKAKGWNWTGTRCLPPTSPADECKKKGWIWDGKRCLSPADACKAKGGVWDGNSCQHKPNPAEQCRKRGGVWDGQRCLSPADICKAKGWNWDGKSCKPPAPSLVPRTTIPR